jgi:broad specificity phosphatase PhoE
MYHSNKGKKQVLTIDLALSQILVEDSSKIYSSDLVRTADTARIIGQILSIEPVFSPEPRVGELWTKKSDLSWNP